MKYTRDYNIRLSLFQVTPAALPNRLGNKTLYPFLTRTGGSYNQLGFFYSELFKLYNWSIIGKITQQFEDTQIEDTPDGYMGDAVTISLLNTRRMFKIY